MEVIGVIIIAINLLVIGFIVWAISNINDKLELLIRIQLKKDPIHFLDKDLEEEIEKYRDR